MFVRLVDSTEIRKCEDGSYLLINLTDGASIHLSEEAELFLHYLSSLPTKLGEIAASISAQYSDVTYEEVYSDLEEFYRTLSEQNLVLLCETPKEIEDYPLKALHIEITFLCNERCIHCYIPNPKKDRSSFMEPELFYKIIDEFVVLGGEELTISGGEPLFHPAFIDFVKYSRGKGLEVSIFSNLLLLTPGLVETLKELKVRSVQTSVYSMDATVHDKITKVPGSLSRTISAIELLKVAGIDVSISSPIMNINQDSAEEIIAYVKRNNFALRLNPMLSARTDGDKSFVEVGRLSIESQRKLLKRLMCLDKEYLQDNLLELNLEAEHNLINRVFSLMFRKHHSKTPEILIKTRA